MLRIVVPGRELFDNLRCEFINTKEQTLQLEHSLVSLSKWEGKYHKPFLSMEPKTMDETVDYIRCMTLTQNVNPHVYATLTRENLDQVTAYIKEPMTATTLPKNSSSGSQEVVTAEILYYRMILYGIPFECQKWHLNRLIMLINVCNAKSKDPKKIPRQELLARNRALNEARKKRFNTSG